ncbi:hypothetical protein C1645_781719 [Glomus cerebriforme]|uniref:Uncharacterized protein n=1 Tax=Glomus cerebriforme TaxID=658196 RepID=A0A397SN64_9GLOM|nr:hypothetical protein C1645_781719 [Glomus cerebriforme]
MVIDFLYYFLGFFNCLSSVFAQFQYGSVRFNIVMSPSVIYSFYESYGSKYHKYFSKDDIYIDLPPYHNITHND